MNDTAILWILGIVGLILFFLIIWGNSHKAQKRKAERENLAIKAASLNAKFQAEADAKVREAKVRAVENRKIGFAVIVGLGFLAFLIWAGFAVSGAVNEWGETRRYRARQQTYVELDMGKTMRQSALMEMMTNKAWADAYKKAGGQSGGGWGMTLLAFLLGALGALTLFVWYRDGVFLWLELLKPSRGPPERREQT